MTDDVCEGCGIPLQSDDPNAPGYVPAHVAKKSESIVCRRCYRISHYGKDDEGPPVTDERAQALVHEVLSRIDACVAVVDLIDFEGSFLPELVHNFGEKLLVAANKVDLLPSKTPPEEVMAWVAERFQAAGITPRGVYPISARSGYGMRVLFDAARKAAGKGGRIGLVGATNVGKSTLLSRWLMGTGGDGPTVSRYPGTTVGLVQRELNGSKIEIIDTPGIIPRSRVSDLLCPECASTLVPDSPLSSKLVRLVPGQALVFGGLAAIAPVGDAPETTALAFAAAGVPIERVKLEKVDRWLQGKLPSGEAPVCEKCHAKLAKDGWEQVVSDVDEMDDLAVHGLGWLSLRRNGMRVRVTVPAGAMVSTRPRLIGPKTPAPVASARG